MENSVPAFRYRWFTENCSQVLLPSGKAIVIDPIFRRDEASCHNERETRYISGFDDSVIESCDYILLTHVHFDHIGSLKALQERFHAPILVNGWSAFALVQHLDLPTGSVIPMTDGCEYNFDDFRVLWQQGRHTAKIGEIRPSVKMEHMDEAETEFLYRGTTYNSNFIIKLPSGMSIAMDGGAFEPHMNELEKHHPTMILRHAERDRELCIAQISQQLARSNSPYLFLLTMQILPDAKGMVDAANERLAKEGIYGRVVYAEPGQWINFSMGAAAE